MSGWLCFLFSLFALSFAQSVFDGEPCEVFAIRREGVVFLRIDTIDTQKVVIPDEFVLTVDTVRTTEFIFNDQYIFSVVKDGDNDQVVIRRRRVDPATGLWVIPRPVRNRLIDGMWAQTEDGEQFNVATLGLWDLRSYLADVNAENLELQGITDPFADQQTYDPAGNVCRDGSDCLSVADDLFEVIMATATTPARDYFNSLMEETASFPAAGEEGYDGEVQRITVKESSEWGGAWLENDAGFVPGEAGFRLTDEEVEDVFWLEAKWVENHEIIPGVSVGVYGWRGGQVYDFELQNGELVGGHIIVGPFPATDPWDVVHFGAKKYGPGGNMKRSVQAEDEEIDPSPFSDLEVSTPGPALTFTYGRKTRVYVQNMIDNEGGVQLSWLGMNVPHDQDGANWDPLPAYSRQVFEFQITSMGTKIYTDTNERAHDWSGLFGGVLSSYPADMMDSWDRRYAHVLVDMAGEEFTMNGESFPGTVTRLGGWWRDRIDILASFPAPDGSGDTIVQISDVPRPPVSDSNKFPDMASECPAYGGPIIGRQGTGCRFGDSGHVHRGHQITSTSWNPGHWVTIVGHQDRALTGIEYTINGNRLAIREGDAPDLLRIKKVGEGTAGGFGGQLYIWRLHKAAWNNPQAQNNGFGGSYMRFNYGEKIAVSYLNPGAGTFPMHIHGHSYSVFAVDGELLASPVVRHTYPLHAGSTFDAVVIANNPNHMGAWMHFAHSPEHLVNPFGGPWPGASMTPGGLLSYVDYTGFAQERLAIDVDGQVASFGEIPPECHASSNVEDMSVMRDILNYEAAPASEWIWLLADVSIPEDDGEPIIEGVEWMWEVSSKPGGADDPIIEVHPTNPSVYQVRHFTVDGDYTFKLVATGQNVERASEDATVGCEAETTITVVGQWVDDDLSRYNAEYFGEPLHGRLAAEAGGPDRGHITFQMFRGWFEDYPNWIDVNITIATSNPPNHSPLWGFDPAQDDMMGERFYRWPVLNSVSHIWHSDIEWTGETERPEWDSDETTPDFTLGRTSLDARINSYNDMTYGRGGVLGADFPSNPTDHKSLPHQVEVLLPMWQGVNRDRFGNVQDVYFLITESSDEKFCKEYGCTYSPALNDVSRDALAPAEWNTNNSRPNPLLRAADRPAHVRQRATTFVFGALPPAIPYGGDDVDVFPPGYAHDSHFSNLAERNAHNYYSPLRGFLWQPAGDVPRFIVANMPFVYWDPTWEVQWVVDDNVTLVDELEDWIAESKWRLPTYYGGCSNTYRSADPTQMFHDSMDYGWDEEAEQFSYPGPGLDCTEIGDTMDVHYGGQLTREPDFELMIVAFKAHKAHYNSETRIPYYILTDSSDLATAQSHGINYAPRLAVLEGAHSTHAGVSSMRVVSNGPITTGGPDDFQPALVGITADTQEGYTPLRHVTHLLWNCGRFDVNSGDFFDEASYERLILSDLVNDDQIGRYWRPRNAYQAVDVDWIPFFYEDHQAADLEWKQFNWSYSTLPENNPAKDRNYIGFVNLPFELTWEGETYSTLVVSLSGLVYLAEDEWAVADMEDGCCAGQLFPNPAFGPAVAVWWYEYLRADWNKITWKVVGEEPHRMFVIEWKDVRHASDQQRPVSFQVKFFEGEHSNTVEVHYRMATNNLPDIGVPQDSIFHAAGIQASADSAFVNLYYDDGDLAWAGHEVAVRYVVPRWFWEGSFGDDSDFDIAQIFGNVKGTYCPSYAERHTPDHSGILWSGWEDALLWSGALLETESPAGSYFTDDERPTVDRRPTVWNAPQVVSYDLTEYNDAENQLTLDNDGILDTGILPGTWLILWNTGNLSPFITADLGFPDPIGENSGPRLYSRWINPLAILAWRDYNVATAGDWWMRDPPTDGWHSNKRLYNDLASDPAIWVVRLADHTSRSVWFTILESDDELFALATGARFVPSLADADNLACELNVQFPREFNEFDPLVDTWSSFDDMFKFAHIPGRLGHNDGRGPLVNPWYSPLKRFTFQGRTVTINAPFVSWGALPGESMIMSAMEDLEPCSPHIRRNLPSELWQNMGPPGCANDGVNPLHPLQSHAGGQVLHWVTPDMFPEGDIPDEWWGVPSVTVKLHKGTGSSPNVVPYYSVWDASDASFAGLMGVPVSYRLRHLDEEYTKPVRSFANGIPIKTGGPWRFEQSVFTDEPTSVARLTWLFYNCNNRVVSSTSFINFGANEAVGDVPKNGSGIPGFDPVLIDEYDPFQVRRDLKSRDCADWVAEVAGQTHRSWKTIDEWIEDGLVFESDDPPGALLNNDLDIFTVANIPQHVLLNLNDPTVIDPEFNLPDDVRYVHIFAIDNAKTWYITDDWFVTAEPIYKCVGEECFQDAQDPDWESLAAKVTVPVSPGDVVNIWTFSSYTPHGLLFWVPSDLDDVLGMHAAELNRFFEINSWIWDPEVETTNPRFMEDETGYWYGDSTPRTGLQLLFQGTVRDTALGTDEYAPWAPYDPIEGRDNRMELWLTDPVFGPASMLVRLHAVTEPPSYLENNA